MRTIVAEMQSRGKAVLALLDRRDVGMLLVIVMVGLGSFGLGHLSGLARESADVRIIPPAPANSAAAGAAQSAAPAEQPAGAVVGSQNSDKYHFPWCSGAQRIKEANLVEFVSIEAARAAGYVPAGNCRGLE